MTVKLNVKISLVAKPPVVTLPPGKILAYVLHDQETAFYNFTPRSIVNPNDKLQNDVGYPEIVPLLFRDYVDLTEAWQWFWFDQLMLSMFGHTDLNLLAQVEQDFIKNAWRGLTKGYTAFCNGKGTNDAHDYINNNTLDGFPGLSQLSCGGNVVELLDANLVTRYGQYYYKVKVLDGTKPPPLSKDVNHATAPQVVNVATNSTPFGFDGNPATSGPWKVDHFHYLNGKPVYFPVASKGIPVSERGFDDAGYYWVVDFIDARRVRLMRQGDQYPPNPTVP